MSRFHPWRYLRDGDVHVSFVRLPDGSRGRTDGKHIWLDKRLLQVERRCTVAHETVHVELGHTECQEGREEDLVRKITAGRLITLDQLLDAGRWARSIPELADELWVTVDVLEDRLRFMHPIERRLLHAAVAKADHIP